MSLTPLRYPEMTCPACGWVHVAIPLALAEQSIAQANDYLRSKGQPDTESLARYLRCFRCGGPTSAFVPAQPADAPMGSTLQAVVIPA